MLPGWYEVSFSFQTTRVEMAKWQPAVIRRSPPARLSTARSTSAPRRRFSCNNHVNRKNAQSLDPVSERDEIPLRGAIVTQNRLLAGRFRDLDFGHK
jgi:hypothetical protein